MRQGADEGWAKLVEAPGDLCCRSEASDRFLVTAGVRQMRLDLGQDPAPAQRPNAQVLRQLGEIGLGHATTASTAPTKVRQSSRRRASSRRPLRVSE